MCCLITELDLQLSYLSANVEMPNENASFMQILELSLTSRVEAVEVESQNVSFSELRYKMVPLKGQVSIMGSFGNYKIVSFEKEIQRKIAIFQDTRNGNILIIKKNYVVCDEY